MEKKKILVVDDDKIVLQSCRMVLEAEGYAVELVSCADDALMEMSRKAFDLLLLDVKMPKHDGMYMIERVKERWSEVPVVLMTGYATTDTIVDGYGKGASGFVAKPFTPDELIRSVRQALGQQ